MIVFMKKRKDKNNSTEQRERASNSSPDFLLIARFCIASRITRELLETLFPQVKDLFE